MKINNELYHYEKLSLGGGISIDIIIQNKVVKISDHVLLLDNAQEIDFVTQKSSSGKQYYFADFNSEIKREFNTINRNFEIYNRVHSLHNLGFYSAIFFSKFQSYFLGNYKKDMPMFNELLESWVKFEKTFER